MFSFIYSKPFWLFTILIALIVGFIGAQFIPFAEESESDEASERTIPRSRLGDSETQKRDLPVQEEQATSSEEGETGDGVDDFGACDEDAHTYCSGLYEGDWQTWASQNGYTTASWKYALVDCLGQHQTSQACSDSLDRREVLNDAMNEACSVDRGKYCKGVFPIPGEEPQVDCLKEYYDELSPECAEALDAHELAKPEELQEEY